jgi:hypothetical protein
LRRYAGVDGVELDFGVDKGHSWLQCHLFPERLVTLAGKAGVGLEISLYGSDKELSHSLQHSAANHQGSKGRQSRRTRG